jgi:hypothetical protein
MEEKKIQSNITFVGPWANKLHAHFLFKNAKKHVKKFDQSQLFWTMGLTILRPPSRKILLEKIYFKKIPNGHSLLGQWANALCTQLFKNVN